MADIFSKKSKIDLYTMFNQTVLEKLKAWRNSPLLFVTECIGATPSSQQAEALKLLPTTKRLSIRSGHGTGKDAFASWAILWFSSTRTYPKVACTAPTARQLSDVLWSELSKWLRKSIIKDEFVIQKDKIFYKEAPKEWWIRALSPSVKASKEDQAETLAGLHNEHLLIIVDEASGVPDPVYVPLEGAMTQEDNKVILIGNPTKNTGYFHETQFLPALAKSWKRLHWDSRKSTNVSVEMVDYFRLKYGEDSNIFRIRVEGNPPLDEDNTFIPLSWAIQCIGNEIEVAEDWPLYLSVDVARYGEDDSIILPRKGNRIDTWEKFNGIHTVELARHIVRTYQEKDAKGVAVDGIGVGGGVVDWLKHDPRGIGEREVVEVNSYDAANDNTKHYRLREELWDEVKTKCRNKKYSFPDEEIKIAGVDIHIGHELANELASLKYFFAKNGAIQLESKMDAKKRGIVSPNIADALALSEYFTPGLTKVMWGEKRKKSQFPVPSGYGNNFSRSNNWMYL